MKITFHAIKNLRNIIQRGLSFERAAAFDFENALILEDSRREYGEPRLIAVGYLGNRLHVLCFTPTVHGIRVIGFRKANCREAKRYAKSFTLN